MWHKTVSVYPGVFIYLEKSSWFPTMMPFFVYKLQVIESLSLLPYQPNQPTPMHSVLCPCLLWGWQPGWGLVLLGVELPVLGALPFLKEKWGCPQGKEEAVRVSDLPTPRDIHVGDPAWEPPGRLLLGGSTMILQPQLSHGGASHNSVLSPGTISQAWLSGGLMSCSGLPGGLAMPLKKHLPPPCLRWALGSCLQSVQGRQVVNKGERV